MRAFQKNIDALENKIELLIQKWRNMQDENIKLIERNKELEEELKLNNSDRLSPYVEITSEKENDKDVKLTNIESALNDYIKRIDNCLELINIELDGK